ncbi:hypothetical protein BDB00DRAFT_961670 [Zychaea mexicana]|uniref:uncharacterized protein n=1 Tax=Zychaea mexicana TaxID=64656 RepID=UPI0022FEFAAF|nr:uncharacterized protein BDB00DRAFT_961670 [Zychaea mexicana]KAI9489872.1 hypothetical protein BDB00DRAFT_961670 [Zychaea mexicana]
MTSQSDRKRRLSLEIDPQQQKQQVSKKSRRCDQNGLLSELTGVLDEIRSTPACGEIPAESLETLKTLMLQIEHLSSDVSNLEARNMKNESERQLESWFDDLLEQCEADGGLDLDHALAEGEDGASDDEEEALALALALMDEEDDEEEQEVATSQQHVSDTGSDTTAQEIDVVA